MIVLCKPNCHNWVLKKYAKNINYLKNIKQFCLLYVYSKVGCGTVGVQQGVSKEKSLIPPPSTFDQLVQKITIGAKKKSLKSISEGPEKKHDFLNFS